LFSLFINIPTSAVSTESRKWPNQNNPPELGRLSNADTNTDTAIFKNTNTDVGIENTENTEMPKKKIPIIPKSRY